MPSLAPRCRLRPGVLLAAGGAAEPKSWKQLGECSSKGTCWEGREREGKKEAISSRRATNRTEQTLSLAQQKHRLHDRSLRHQCQRGRILAQELSSLQVTQRLCAQVPTKKLDQTKAPEGLHSSLLVARLKQPELTEWDSLGFSRDVRTISEVFRSQLAGGKADTSCTTVCSEHPAQKHTTGGFPGGAATTARGQRGRES